MNVNDLRNLKVTFLKKSRNIAKELSKTEAGFSLVEILVALTLLGIAGTFVAGQIFQSLEDGQKQAASIQMANLKKNLKEFRRKCGYYPDATAGLFALVEAPADGKCKNYPPEGFLEDGVVPLDPWDNDYIYKLDGSSPEIISNGPDREPGTEDDISSKRQQRRSSDN